jgi:hypothetical protein
MRIAPHRVAVNQVTILSQWYCKGELQHRGEGRTLWQLLGLRNQMVCSGSLSGAVKTNLSTVMKGAPCSNLLARQILRLITSC